MILSDQIIQTLAAFCENNGYEEIVGEFTALEASPDEYDIPVSIDMVIKPNGNYAQWITHPLQDKVIGRYRAKGGEEGRIFMGPSVESDEKEAVIHGILSRL